MDQGNAASAFPASFVINQNQNAVSGTYSDDESGATSGNVTATLTGTALLNFSLEQASPCAGTFSDPSSASIANNEILAHLTGSDCSAVTSYGIRLARADDPPLSGLYHHDPATSFDVIVFQLADTLFLSLQAQGLYRAILSGASFSGGAAGPNPHCIISSCGVNSGIPITGSISGATISGTFASQFPTGTSFTFSATKP